MHLTESISLLARNQTENKPVLVIVTSLKETKNEQNRWKNMSDKKKLQQWEFHQDKKRRTKRKTFERTIRKKIK